MASYGAPMTDDEILASGISGKRSYVMPDPLLDKPVEDLVSEDPLMESMGAEPAYKIGQPKVESLIVQDKIARDSSPDDDGFWNQFYGSLESTIFQSNPRLSGRAIEGLGRVSGIDVVTELGQNIVTEFDSSPPEEKFTPRISTYKDVDGLNELLDYVGFGLGQGLGSMGMTIGGVVVGGGLAAAGGAAVGAYAGGVGAIPAGAAAAVAGGATGGAIAGSFLLNYGDMYDYLVEQEGMDEDTAANWALIPGTAMAGLDAYGLSRLAGPLRQKLSQDLAKRTAQLALQGGGIEGITEASQQIIQETAGELAETLGYSTEDIEFSQRWENIVNGGIIGLLTGGTVGGASASVVKPTPTPAPGPTPGPTPTPGPGPAPTPVESAFTDDNIDVVTEVARPGFAYFTHSIGGGMMGRRMGLMGGLDTLGGGIADAGVLFDTRDTDLGPSFRPFLHQLGFISEGDADGRSVADNLRKKLADRTPYLHDASVSFLYELPIAPDADVQYQTVEMDGKTSVNMAGANKVIADASMRLGEPGTEAASTIAERILANRGVSRGRGLNSVLPSKYIRGVFVSGEFISLDDYRSRVQSRSGAPAPVEAAPVPAADVKMWGKGDEPSYYKDDAFVRSIPVTGRSWVGDEHTWYEIKVEGESRWINDVDLDKASSERPPNASGTGPYGVDGAQGEFVLTGGLYRSSQLVGKFLVFEGENQSPVEATPEAEAVPWVQSDEFGELMKRRLKGFDTIEKFEAHMEHSAQMEREYEAKREAGRLKAEPVSEFDEEAFNLEQEQLALAGRGLFSSYDEMSREDLADMITGNDRNTDIANMGRNDLIEMAKSYDDSPGSNDLLNWYNAKRAKAETRLLQDESQEDGRPLGIKNSTAEEFHAKINELKTGKEVAQFLVESAEDPSFQKLAERIIPHLDDVTVTAYGIGEKSPSKIASGKARGYITTVPDGVGATISLRGAGLGASGVNATTVLHELLHAATMRRLGDAKFGANEDTQLQNAFIDLRSLTTLVHEGRREIQKQFESEGRKFGDYINDIPGPISLNTDEVLAWGLTDKKFQDFLRTIKIGNETAFSKFVRIIMDLLGIPESERNGLTEIIRITDEVLNAPLDELKVRRQTLGGDPESVSPVAEQFEETDQPPAAAMKLPETPEEIEKAFTALGEAQRGAPEDAMMDVYTVMSGEYAWSLEHVGDLNWRNTTFRGGKLADIDEGMGKIRQTNKSLHKSYGFEKHIKDQIGSEAKVTGRAAGEIESELRAAGQKYADEHRKLTVYNEIQILSKEAAIALGEWRFDDARTHLAKLQGYVDEGAEAFTARASRVDAPQPPAAANPLDPDIAQIRADPSASQSVLETLDVMDDLESGRKQLREGMRHLDLASYIRNMRKAAVDEYLESSAKPPAAAAESDDYRVSHQPSKGPSGDEIGTTDDFPKDILQHPEWYTGYPKEAKKFWPKIVAGSGNPDAKITIYRAMPKDAGSTIENGNWVTPSKAYAEYHAEGEEGWHIVAVEVPLRDINWAGDDLMEWGYWGSSTKPPAATGLSEVERAQLGTPKGGRSGFDYISEENWPILREMLVRNRAGKKTYKQTETFGPLDPELTAYTPGETLKLLSHPKIVDWHNKVSNYKIPDEYETVVLVPCATSKPWGAAACGGAYYPAYNKILKEVESGEIPGPVFFATISEPLGIVPMDMWGEFPAYDNPGLFNDDPMRSGMETKDWNASQFGQKYMLPFDQEAKDKSIDILGDVVANFVDNNQSSGRQFMSFVDVKDMNPKKPTTHALMLERAEKTLDREIVSPTARFGKGPNVGGQPKWPRIYDHIRKILSTKGIGVGAAALPAAGALMADDDDDLLQSSMRE